MTETTSKDVYTKVTGCTVYTDEAGDLYILRRGREDAILEVFPSDSSSYCANEQEQPQLDDEELIDYLLGSNMDEDDLSTMDAVDRVKAVRRRVEDGPEWRGILKQLHEDDSEDYDDPLVTRPDECPICDHCESHYRPGEEILGQHGAYCCLSCFQHAEQDQTDPQQCDHCGARTNGPCHCQELPADKKTPTPPPPCDHCGRLMYDYTIYGEHGHYCSTACHRFAEH